MGCYGNLQSYTFRQLAQGFRVSRSYLSQVKSGKHPTSDKVVSKIVRVVCLMAVMFCLIMSVNGSVAQW